MSTKKKPTRARRSVDSEAPLIVASTKQWVTLEAGDGTYLVAAAAAAVDAATGEVRLPGDADPVGSLGEATERMQRLEAGDEE